MSELLLLAIPTAPLLASLLITLASPLGLRKFAAWPCILALLVSAVCSLGLLAEGQVAHATIKTAAVSWIDAGYFSIDLGLRADTLSAIMLAMVSNVSLLIAIYSVGYLHGHPGCSRFFAAISLFVCAMTLLVSAANFVVLYLAWEAVGVCSYLLIGFYQDRPAAAAAAKKAFLVNRIGDLGFLLGIFWLFRLVLAVAPGVENPVDYDTVFAVAGQIASNDPLGLTVACLLLFCGAVGKSAQFPLHTWLPDAMEGPSPVSALIHAATMVTAGVYLVARINPLLIHVPTVQLTIAIVGAFTALLAGLIALTQYDLKRVLAYSTVSQLGYMFLALGTPAGRSDPTLQTAAVTAAMFHLFTHAFFKALLFLSAGSVMHAMGDVIDMRRFGGLRRALPFTHILFLCGAVALAGLPIFSGFWSKDNILEVVEGATHGPYAAIFSVLQIGILLTSFLTAFYTFRAYFMTFWGAERFPEEAGHHPHESPWVMLVPMGLLAVPALFIGLVLGPGIGFHVDDRLPSLTLIPSQLFNHYLVENTPMLVATGHHHTAASVVLSSIAAGILGLLLAWQFYIRRPSLPGQFANAIEPFYKGSLARFYFDEIYSAIIVRPLETIAGLLPRFDRHSLDKIVDAFASIPVSLGSALRGWQNGFVQSYAAWMLFGLALLLAMAVSQYG